MQLNPSAVTTHATLVVQVLLALYQSMIQLRQWCGVVEPLSVMAIKECGTPTNPINKMSKSCSDLS